MTWYESYYKENDSLKFLVRTFSRKEAFTKARKFASKSGKPVTVSEERGMYLKFYSVLPEEVV